MKNINIEKKIMKNITMKNINIEKKIMKNIQKWNTELLNKNNHIKYVNMVYLDQEFTDNKLIKKALKSKLSSYRQQDTKKKQIY